jgi:hypothetical protein
VIKKLDAWLTAKILRAQQKVKAFCRREKRILSLLAGGALASTILQLSPGFTSKTGKDYLEEQGLPAAVAEEFHTKNIRVYDRYNPLYPIHLGGFTVRALHPELKDAGLEKTYSYPLAVVSGYYLGIKTFFSLYIPPYRSVDAFSVKTPLSLEARACFVRPPGRMTAQEFLNEFTGTDDSIVFTTKTDPARLSKALKDFALLHELRHCDQDLRMDTIVNETDADVGAFEIMRRSGLYAPETLEELRHIVAQLRIFNGAKGDIEHMSKTAMDRGPQTPAATLDDESSTRQLRMLTVQAYNLDRERLKDVFGEDMKSYEKVYHVTQALMASGILDTRPAVLTKAQEFTSSVEYFNALADGKMLTKKDLSKDVRLDYLSRPYAPVPEKKPSAAPSIS